MGRNKHPKYLEAGMKFGRLTVIEVDQDTESRSKLKPSSWKYKCECSCTAKTIVSVRKCNLISGHTKSCGCYQREQTSQACRKVNPIDVCGNTIKIWFFNKPDLYTEVDKEDYDKVKEYCWMYDTTNTVGYAIANLKSGGLIRMHQIILPTDKGKLADHIDGNGLNNKKTNLRVSTQTQNNMNRRLQSNNTSGVAGVDYSKSRNMWRSRIKLHGKEIGLGYFLNKEDAIKARKEAEEKYFGEYSYDNSRGKENK